MGCTPPRTLKDTGLRWEELHEDRLSSLQCLPSLRSIVPGGMQRPRAAQGLCGDNARLPKGTLSPAVISCPATPQGCIRQQAMSRDIALQQCMGKLRQRKGLTPRHRAGGIHVV